MIKGILEKLFKKDQKSNQPDVKYVNHDEVEALVDAKIKEHAAALQTTSHDQEIQNQALSQDDFTLTAKQIEYALSLIEKVNNEFILAIDPAKLTIKDLNRLIAYNRYKNKGTLINLVKKGVLRKR
ncbi:ABC transporter ATP-binding protein [Neobacillus sp.]|uniref:ABC transporter ATP-binding protein n=1 Tax=Neobacillus sp. TaxID=2675273 RepID=UPI00289CC0FA|nr:ABC transporter ATP-binding protein [Neobacillus sp.]